MRHSTISMWRTRRVLLFFALSLFTLAANAGGTTYYYYYHARAHVYPSGLGKVYISTSSAYNESAAFAETMDLTGTTSGTSKPSNAGVYASVQTDYFMRGYATSEANAKAGTFSNGTQSTTSTTSQSIPYNSSTYDSESAAATAAASSSPTGEFWAVFTAAQYQTALCRLITDEGTEDLKSSTTPKVSEVLQSVSGAPVVVNLGEQATVQATAQPGYEFDHWENLDGTILSYDNPATVTVTTKTYFYAVFKKSDLKITIPEGGMATICNPSTVIGLQLKLADELTPYIVQHPDASKQSTTLGTLNDATLTASDNRERGLELVPLTDVRSNTDALTQYKKMIPGRSSGINYAVVVMGEPGTYEYTMETVTTGTSGQSAAAIYGNLLIGATTDLTPTDTDNYDYFVLSKKNDKLAFYKLASGVTIPAGRGYLRAEKASSTSKEFIEFSLGGGSTTQIDSFEADCIDMNAPVYNLSGQRVGSSYKGVVIQRGKKYVRK